MPHTLIISTELPAAPMTGARVRTHYLAHALAQLGPVTVAGFVPQGEPVPVLAAPLRTAAVPWRPPPLYAEMHSGVEPGSSRAFEILADHVREPWIVSYYESEELHATVKQICNEGVDLVVIDHTLMGAYLEDVPSGVPTVLNLHNVH